MIGNRVGKPPARVMPVPPSEPHDPHARDFAAWERQMSRGRPRFAAYAAVYGVVLICGAALVLLHDPMLGVAVLLIAAVVTILWFSER